MRSPCILLLLSFAAGGTPALGQALADERIVWGKVLSVVPVEESITVQPVDPACSKPKPERTAGLSALLRWDLRERCASRLETRVSHYRVRYRWDGRVYSQDMKNHPGEKVPLVLTVGTP